MGYPKHMEDDYKLFDERCATTGWRAYLPKTIDRPVERTKRKEKVTNDCPIGRNSEMLKRYI